MVKYIHLDVLNKAHLAAIMQFKALEMGMQPLKYSAVATVIGVIAIGVLVTISMLSIAGLTWLVNNTFYYVILAAEISFFICAIVFLPIAIVPRARVVSAWGLLVGSFVFGLVTWMTGFVFVQHYWGDYGLAAGLLLGLVGVVPLGVLASLVNGDWFGAGCVLMGLVLTFGSRVVAVTIAHHAVSFPAVGKQIARLVSLFQQDKRYFKIMGTVVVVLGIGAQAAYWALHPSPSDFQSIVDLQVHPIASLLGAMVPSVLCIPIVYWTFGKIFARMYKSRSKKI